MSSMSSMSGDPIPNPNPNPNPNPKPNQVATRLEAAVEQAAQLEGKPEL